MRPIVFRISMLEGVPGGVSGDGSVRPGPGMRAGLLRPLLDALTRANELYMATRIGVPSLYESGIRYRLEDDAEEWKDYGVLLEDGVGDCEDLACARAAELRRRGADAWAFPKWSITPSGRVDYHIVVGRRDIGLDPPPRPDHPRHVYTLNGHLVEDPSYILGMR